MILEARLAVGSVGPVLADAHHVRLAGLVLAPDAVRRVAVALATGKYMDRVSTEMPGTFLTLSSSSPSAHREVRDGVVVGPEDFGIAKDFVSESV